MICLILLKLRKRLWKDSLIENSRKTWRLEKAGSIKNQLPMVVMFAQKMEKGLL